MKSASQNSVVIEPVTDNVLLNTPRRTRTSSLLIRSQTATYGELTEKVCLDCGLVKPLSDFYTKPKISTYCRACHNVRCVRWQHNNPDKHKASEAAYRERNRARIRSKYQENQALHRRRHPDHYYARNQVTIALKTGRLVKGPCVVCGTTKQIQAHHPDYTKPLDVMWLCRLHHKEEHTKTAPSNAVLVSNKSRESKNPPHLLVTSLNPGRGTCLFPIPAPDSEIKQELLTEIIC